MRSIEEIVAIYDDVTDKKKAEAEQKTLQEKLISSQKMEPIGAFAAARLTKKQGHPSAPRITTR